MEVDPDWMIKTSSLRTDTAISTASSALEKRFIVAGAPLIPKRWRISEDKSKWDEPEKTLTPRMFERDESDGPPVVRSEECFEVFERRTREHEADAVEETKGVV